MHSEGLNPVRVRRMDTRHINLTLRANAMRARQAILPAVALVLLHLQVAAPQSQTQTPNKSQAVPSASQGQAQADPPRRPNAVPDRKTRAAIEEALLTIQQNYADGERLQYEELFRRSILGMLRALDPHSDFYTKKDFDEQRAEWARSEYYGIGATIGNRRLRGREIDTFILSTFKNSPARRAGLSFGDRILEANGESMVGKFSSEVRDKLRGPKGTVVRITIERAATGNRETVALTREPVPQPTVPDAYMIAPGVGYIDMSRGFNLTTSQELMAAIENLKSQNMTSLVLDLRNNSGGILAEAVKSAERFLLKDQIVVSQKGTGPATAVSRTLTSLNPAPETVPLVVLVNRSTASAAEIMAGALRDQDRALIVGEPTFGKALVQSIIPLEYGAGLTITTSRYYTPSGSKIQRDYSQIGYYDYITGGGLGSERNIPTPKGAPKRTASGRPVFDGPVAPDQVGIVKPRTFTPLQQRLFDPVFGFVRELINGRITAPDLDTKQFHVSGPSDLNHDLQPGELKVDDRLFEGFKAYVAKRREIYRFTDAQLDREREAIKRQLRFELVTAAYGVINAARVLIADDPQILKALQVLPEARELTANSLKRATP